MSKTMRPNKQTLKAQRLTKLEQKLDEALARLDDDTPLNLDEIEEIALKVRTKMGQALPQALAETQTAAPLDHPRCPACRKGLFPRDEVWRVAADLFPCSVQIVDWHHATHPLAQALTAQ